MRGFAALPGSVAWTAVAALAWAGPADTQPPGLLFHVSFDKLTTEADFARGDGHSTFEGSLELRPAEGVRGAGLLQRKGERCTYKIDGNLDTSQGTFSIWVKPLNWDGHSGKFRHFLTVVAGPEYRQLVYLYPIGDEAVFHYIQVNAGTPNEAIWRAGSPVDILQRGQWTHLAATWDAHSVRLYADGQRAGEGLVASPLPKIAEGGFTICPVDYWGNAQWGDPEEQTVCDEVRIFDHALSDDEVLDLYALDVPGGLALRPELALGLAPDYAGGTLSLSVRVAHADAAWQELLKPGAVLTAEVRDPQGKTLLTHAGKPADAPLTAPVGKWIDGEYAATATLSAGGRTLEGKAFIVKPPTPWLPPERDWRADRVLPPWEPLRREGQTVRYWDGEIALSGGLPTAIITAGQPLLSGPIRLVAGSAAEWQTPQATEEEPFRVTLAGEGRLGSLTAACSSLVEFDGLIRCDVTLTPPDGGASLPKLALEIPLRPEVATYYRNPACKPWDGKALDEPDFLPYAWLGSEERGLSWFMESSANWRIGEGRPAMTIRREGDSVVVRLQLISEPTEVTKPLSYTFGFEPTPVRPPDPNLYARCLASGPQIKGSNYFVYGWGQQISALNGSLIAYDPADQRKLVDGWRAQGKESLSYSCTQCTASLSPEYRFFAPEWNQPYGATFSGYKRYPDDAPYSMVPVCPRSTFADFLVWCVKEHLRNDWGGGIYTDIDGAIPCDNAAHGCGFTDAFGRSGRTYPLYAHRALSRRIYAACHDAGKPYFAHAHSNWYAPFNAFNDGWCPGEQYSTAVLGKPSFYMDDIPDRTWRAEFYSPTTGVSTYLLPEIDRLAPGAASDPGSTECLLAAALVYGVPLWAGSMNISALEEVWGVQQAFGIADCRFVPFWEQQAVACSDADIRVSCWEKPGSRLLAIANFTDGDKAVELRPTDGHAGARFEAAWKAADLTSTDGGARCTLPAKRGALVLMTG